MSQQKHQLAQFVKSEITRRTGRNYVHLKKYIDSMDVQALMDFRNLLHALDHEERIRGRRF